MLKEVFNNKKVLFIGVAFYEYHLEIKNKMEQYGAEVTFFAERDTSIKYGIVNRLFPSYLDAYQQKHYTSILKKIANQKYDYLLVIRGLRMPASFVRAVKAMNPGITCIMYQWDANINSPFLDLEEGYNITGEFDKVLSFDFQDVEQNPWIKYSPTFYIDEVKELANKTKTEPKKIDFFFFGSYLPERYKGLIKFRDYAAQHGYTLHSHFYMSYRYYLIERLKGTQLDKSLISFKPMSRKEYLALFNKSKAIVDVSNAKQTGLAMRVIDAIGTGKKVLTTNKWVTKEPSFNPDQIAIIDLNNIELPPSFLEKEIEASTADYSLDKWLENIFA
ncbi:hypothetical protein HMJ29_02935 [Hymenobacter taeanensis]|uniref:Lipopolysaccharide biosynthesis protein n=1 Tax=Hymenobacter taeanensis TaxID=2735321 RepID=A0A6M6BDN3_9BACT|nr:MULTISPECIES: hypothetical protein [Hymenobacter]QJX45948.1 hypothetical protein HMJ29_02935 [Hymenobacter taeanensis]UOQ79795.1 hypothetical protein MUN83_13170 [Hymenobacter sp. 5414T-23]